MGNTTHRLVPRDYGFARGEQKPRIARGLSVENKESAFEQLSEAAAVQSTKRDRRAYQRKPPRGRCQVKLFRGTLGLGRNLALELLDVSLSGARIRVEEKLRPGEDVQLHLLGQGHLRPVKILAKVVWCRAEAEGAVVGVHFDKMLAYLDFLHIT